MSNPHNIDHVGPEVAALILGLDEAFKDDIATNGYSPFGGGVGYYESLFNAACGFCLWADNHVNFDKLGECWPYCCRDDVAPVLKEVLDELAAKNESMEDFGNHSAKIVCARLKLPLTKNG